MAPKNDIEASVSPLDLPPFELLVDALTVIDETLQRNGIPRFAESLPRERVRWANPNYAKMYGELSLLAAKAIRSGYDAGIDQMPE